MKFILLTQEKIAIVDKQDYTRLNTYIWHAVCFQGRWYAALSIPGKQRKHYMHRVLVPTPPGWDVDHINGNTLDNRRRNLRASTKSQNQRNRHAVSGSVKYKGVRRHQDGRFYSVIKVNGLEKWLGSFDHPVKAAHAYDRAARLHFGSFAHVNFPAWK